MQDLANSTFGLVGVAPEADIGMYRVFGCGGGVPNDIIMLAMQQAAIDKVDILSLSLGSSASFEVDDLFADITTALEALGIVVVVANGNSGPNVGASSTPAMGRGVVAVGSVQSSHYPTVYVSKDSRGRSLKYSGDPWPVLAPKTGLKVYDFANIAKDTSSPLG